MGEKPRVAIYCRVGSPEQQDQALDEQERILKMYADMKGYDHVFTGRDAGASDAPVHPGFRAVMDAAKAGQFDILLMRDISRIARDMSKALALQDYISEHGIKIETPDAVDIDKCMEQLRLILPYAQNTTVKTMSVDELAKMTSDEGLILQGCGGDLNEWVNGINAQLTAQGILLNGSRFEKVSVFQHDGLTNLLFHFGDDVELNMGKLAFWRLQTHAQFGGTWLSDYLPNRLGVINDDEEEIEVPAASKKPKAALIGADGNIFNLIGIATRALNEQKMADEAKEMRDRAMRSNSYDETLRILSEYVEPVSQDEIDSEMESAPNLSLQ